LSAPIPKPRIASSPMPIALQKPPVPTSQPPFPQDTPEYKNGFTLKNCSKEQFDEIIKRAKAIKGVNAKSSTENFSKPNELVTVEIFNAQKQRVYLRFMPQKKSLVLQGKRSVLYTEIQLLLTQKSDFKEAITSHIKISDGEQKTSDVAKRLKKLIPNAYDFLSEQSKIDLGIGLIDLNNEETKLSDYSVLLVPPFRGLERLIFDLQSAENITVKMIGQAYEKKDDGSYCLKYGYRKKINSIVYNEVLSALYTEYFIERHNFTHSDNTVSSSARVISNRVDAKKKFDNLLQIIDYNCKKLIEIGFSIGGIK
ncbi:MAG: hypothetical protein FWC82_04065, partial [Firmicutes bacterium]|nr:hypothetical protein [Bacillota bacterium]